MKFRFNLDSSILNMVYTFSRHLGGVYMLNPNSKWLLQTKEYLTRRASLAGVSIDSELHTSEFFNDKLTPPATLREDFTHYFSTRTSLHELPKFSVDIRYELLEELHCKILGQEYVEGTYSFRTKDKVIPRLVSYNGVYKKVELPIKTKPSEIKQELDAFVDFINSEFKTNNPFILAALSHLSLLKIHPYQEGNGRLARIYEKRILNAFTIDPLNLLATEDYYLLNRERYYELIQSSINELDVTRWIEFFISGLLYSSQLLIRKLYEISGGTIDIQNNTIIEVTEKEVEIIDILNKLTQAGGAEIGRMLKVTRQNINTIMNRLIEKGIVTKVGRGASLRYTLLINS